MVYFYLSNVSHLHHYFRCAELYDVRAVSYSRKVKEFFERQQIPCIHPPEEKLTDKLIAKRDVVEFAKTLSAIISPEDCFVITERLIDYGSIALVKYLVKKNGIKVECWENHSVTQGYQSIGFARLDLRTILRIIKYFIKYGVLFENFYAHDNNYLGVSRGALLKWGVSCKVLDRGDPLYIFDYSAKWRIKNFSDDLHKFVLFAVGYSINDESGFYASTERKTIVDCLIKNVRNVRLKYPPASESNGEYSSDIQINKEYLIEELFPNVDILVSDYSTCLITASMMGVQAVSIIDMVEITNPDRHAFWKNYLTKWNVKKEILFPKDVGELMAICNAGRV